MMKVIDGRSLEVLGFAGSFMLLLHTFKAINDSSSSGVDEEYTQSETTNASPSFEVQEQLVLKHYNAFLDSYSADVVSPQSAVVQSQQLLQEVDKLLHEKAISGDPKATLSKCLVGVKCSLLRLLANSEAESEHASDAVARYLSLLDLQSSDFLSWRKLGDLAVRLKLLLLARYAYEEALKYNRTYWHCLDQLICVLYLLEDYTSCLDRIALALSVDPSYKKGFLLRAKIFVKIPVLKKLYEECPLGECGSQPAVSLGSDCLQNLLAYEDELVESCALKDLDVVPCRFSLASFSWQGICGALCEQYDHMLENCSFAQLVSFDIWNSSPTSNIDLLAQENAENDAIVCILRNLVNKTCSDEATDDFCENNLSDDGFATPSELAVDSQESSAEQSDADQPQDKSSLGSSSKRSRRSEEEIAFYKRRSTRLVPGLAGYFEELAALESAPKENLDLLREKLLECMPATLRCKVSAKAVNGLCSPVKSNTSISPHKLPNLLPMTDDCQANRCSAEQFVATRTSSRKSILEHLLDYLLALCDSALTSWNVDTTEAFFKCFLRWKQHVQFPFLTHPLSESLLRLAKISLAFVELFFLVGQDALAKIFDEESVSIATKQFDDCINFLSFAVPLETAISSAEWHDFACRCYWIMANSLYAKQNFTAASGTVHELQRLIEACEMRSVSLPKYYRTHHSAALSELNAESIEAFAESIDRKLQLVCVRELLAEGSTDEVVAILTANLRADLASESQLEDRQSYLEILCDVLRSEQIADAKSYFHWSVQSFANALALLKQHPSAVDSQQRVIHVINDLQTFIALNDCFASIDESDLVSLVSGLFDMILWSLDVNPTVTIKVPKPQFTSFEHWILLYKIIQRIEHELYDEEYAKAWFASADSSDTVLATKALTMLWFAHEHLGRLRWCNASGGALLIFLADEILECLKQPLFCDSMPSGVRDDMLNTAEQCFYCLYNYPQKRRRHLDEHDVTPVAMQWDRLFTLFEFVKPECMPEFDDRRSTARNSITQEDEALFRKIVSLVPRDLSPEHLLPKLREFLEGKCYSMELPRAHDEYPILHDIFHLLADYNMKTGFHEEAKQFYMSDICLNFQRFDSWAGLSLLNSRLLSEKFLLGYACITKEYFDGVMVDCKACMKSFEQALKLRRYHGTLWVEYGLIAYQVQAYVARFLRKNKEIGSEERQELTVKRRNLLQLSRRAYMQANQIARDFAHDPIKAEAANATINVEEWLHNFMLGKISQKLNLPPKVVLGYFRNALYFLARDVPRLPEKIRYQNPQKYALETLEVFYRVHAAVLKWIFQEQHLSEVDLMLEIINITRHSPFALKELGSSDVRESLLCEQKALSDPTVCCLVDELLDDVCRSNVQARAVTGLMDAYYDELLVEDDQKEIEHIVEHLLAGVDHLALQTKAVCLCMEAMELCNRRFPNHHKSLFWLAKCCLQFPALKDLEMAKSALLGPVDGRFNVPQGLFQDRKQNNFFNGIFRIPIDDIDRFGSLPEHLFKSASTIINLWTELQDVTPLFELTIQFSRKPDKEKQYLNECDREELFALCLRKLPLAFRSKIDRAKATKNKELTVDLLLEVFKIVEKCRNAAEHQADLELLKCLLKDVHLMFLGIEQSDSITPFRDAIACCQTLQKERIVAKAQQERRRLAAAVSSISKCPDPVLPNDVVKQSLPVENSPGILPTSSSVNSVTRPELQIIGEVVGSLAQNRHLQNQNVKPRSSGLFKPISSHSNQRPVMPTKTTQGVSVVKKSATVSQPKTFAAQPGPSASQARPSANLPSTVRLPSVKPSAHAAVAVPSRPSSAGGTWRPLLPSPSKSSQAAGLLHRRPIDHSRPVPFALPSQEELLRYASQVLKRDVKDITDEDLRSPQLISRIADLMLARHALQRAAKATKAAAGSSATNSSASSTPTTPSKPTASAQQVRAFANRKKPNAQLSLFLQRRIQKELTEGKPSSRPSSANSNVRPSSSAAVVGPLASTGANENGKRPLASVSLSPGSDGDCEIVSVIPAPAAKKSKPSESPHVSVSALPGKAAPKSNSAVAKRCADNKSVPSTTSGDVAARTPSLAELRNSILKMQAGAATGSQSKFDSVVASVASISAKQVTSNQSVSKPNLSGIPAKQVTSNQSASKSSSSKSASGGPHSHFLDIMAAVACGGDNSAAKHLKTSANTSVVQQKRPPTKQSDAAATSSFAVSPCSVNVAVSSKLPSHRPPGKASLDNLTSNTSSSGSSKPLSSKPRSRPSAAPRFVPRPSTVQRATAQDSDSLPLVSHKKQTSTVPIHLPSNQQHQTVGSSQASCDGKSSAVQGPASVDPDSIPLAFRKKQAKPVLIDLTSPERPQPSSSRATAGDRMPTTKRMSQPVASSLDSSIVVFKAAGNVLPSPKSGLQPSSSKHRPVPIVSTASAASTSAPVQPANNKTSVDFSVSSLLAAKVPKPGNKLVAAKEIMQIAKCSSANQSSSIVNNSTSLAAKSRRASKPSNTAALTNSPATTSSSTTTMPAKSPKSAPQQRFSPYFSASTSVSTTQQVLSTEASTAAAAVTSTPSLQEFLSQFSTPSSFLKQLPVVSVSTHPSSSGNAILQPKVNLSALPTIGSGFQPCSSITTVATQQKPEAVPMVPFTPSITSQPKTLGHVDTAATVASSLTSQQTSAPLTTSAKKRPRASASSVESPMTAKSSQPKRQRKVTGDILDAAPASTAANSSTSAAHQLSSVGEIRARPSLATDKFASVSSSASRLNAGTSHSTNVASQLPAHKLAEKSSPVSVAGFQTFDFRPGASLFSHTPPSTTIALPISPPKLNLTADLKPCLPSDLSPSASLHHQMQQFYQQKQQQAERSPSFLAKSPPFSPMLSPVRSPFDGFYSNSKLPIMSPERPSLAQQMNAISQGQLFMHDDHANQLAEAEIRKAVSAKHSNAGLSRARHDQSSSSFAVKPQASNSTSQHHAFAYNSVPSFDHSHPGFTSSFVPQQPQQQSSNVKPTAKQRSARPSKEAKREQMSSFEMAASSHHHSAGPTILQQPQLHAARSDTFHGRPLASEMGSSRVHSVATESYPWLSELPNASFNQSYTNSCSSALKQQQQQSGLRLPLMPQQRPHFQSGQSTSSFASLQQQLSDFQQQQLSSAYQMRSPPQQAQFASQAHNAAALANSSWPSFAYTQTGMMTIPNSVSNVTDVDLEVVDEFLASHRGKAD